MSCSCIGMGLVIYYIDLVMILEGIGNCNVIWFCNYNRNHHSGNRSIVYGFVLGILYHFVLLFGICLEIYEALTIV